MDDFKIKASAIYNLLKEDPDKYTNEKVAKDYGLTVKDLLNVAKANSFYFDEDRKNPDYFGLAHYLKNFFNMFYCSSGGFVYCENNKYYSRIDDGFLDNLINQVSEQKIKPQHLNNFCRTVKMVTYKKEIPHSPVGKINLANGILDINSRKLLPHSPEYFFDYIIPINYDKNATCTEWLKFLNNIFPENPEYACVMAQIFGYILLGGYPFLHKAFVLYGEGRNGKSTLLHILDRLIGTANFSTVSLSCLDKPFSVYHLYGKLANISGETPTEKINAEIFKQATTGEYLIGARKYQDEFKFPCHARFIFACNELPRFGESTMGMEERLYFIPFKRFFKKEERDHGIKAKLEVELSGILNWAISGLDILLSEKRLPEIAAAEEIMNEYKSESDSVFAWAVDNVIIDKSLKTQVSSLELYDYYKNWTRCGNRHPVSEMTFFKRFKRFLKNNPIYDEKLMFDKKNKKYSQIFVKPEIVKLNAPRNLHNTNIYN
jgi:putative DNA primase/helicase